MQTISPLVGDAGVSIEVFADFDTTAEEMLAQGREMVSWIPNAYVKYPCTHEGLRAAQMSVRESMRVNMTLCFSQEQAARYMRQQKSGKSGQLHQVQVDDFDQIHLQRREVYNQNPNPLPAEEFRLT